MRFQAPVCWQEHLKGMEPYLIIIRSTWQEIYKNE